MNDFYGEGSENEEWGSGEVESGGRGGRYKAQW